MGLFSYDNGVTKYLPLLVVTVLCLYSCSVDSNRPSDDNLLISFQFKPEPLLSHVDNASLKVISDRQSTVFDTSFDVNLSAGDPPHFDIQVHPEDGLILRAWFFDEPRRPLYRAFRAVNITDDPATIIILDMAQTGYFCGTHVNILRDEPPWDSFGLDTALIETGLTLGAAANQFEIFPSSQLTSMELSPGTDLLVISNDQPQGFYDNLAFSLGIITGFVSSGGTVFWEACDLAWNYGSFAAAGLDSFPGGITLRTAYDPINIIADHDLEILRGLEDTLSGTYASNKFLADVPDSVIVYMQNTTGNPTLICIKFGDGMIFYSGQPLEYNFDRRYDYNMGYLLPRILHFMLGIPWGESVLQSSGRIMNARPSRVD